MDASDAMTTDASDAMTTDANDAALNLQSYNG